MKRTQHLLDLIELHKPKVITEIGVGKGQGAAMMIQHALKYQDAVTYHGFDVFAEGYTDDVVQREFQGKTPLAFDQMVNAFSGLADGLRKHGKELRWHLHRGPTVQTLLDSRADPARKADFAYIDGGHSVETIRHDLTQLKEAKVILLDEWYYDRPIEFSTKFGCNVVLQELYPGNFAFMPIIQTVPAGDGNPIGVGQAVVPRTAWPWARLMAPLTAIRHHKPKRVFVYGDDLSKKYIRSVVEGYQGQIITDETEKADLAYVDCIRRTPHDDNIEAMDEAEALDCWDRTANIPIRIFGGLQQGVMEGAGHILAVKKPDVAIITGLDLINGVEVAAFCYPKSAWPVTKSQIHVATKNCVDDSVIQDNIKANYPRIRKWAQTCGAHDGKIAFVSAGPSLDGLLHELRHTDRKVVCVKHAHDKLIEAGIVPWACVLLDPRDHVSQFVENPHPETIYFVASMVSPKTMDILLEKKATIVGYNALVGAGEEKLLPKGTEFLVGGTSAAMRGLPLLLMLGFRDFLLYSYDSCFTERPANIDEKTKLGYNRYVKVEIGGRKFWTELELVAQGQDFKQFMEHVGQAEMISNLKLDVRGEGMIQHLWQLMRKVRPSFADVTRSWISP